MVEMVILLPLLLMLLFSIAEFGVIFSRWQALSNAAREGARTSVLFRSPCDATEVQNAVRDRVRDYASPLGITLADSDIVVQGACGAANTTSTVTVTAPYTFRVLDAFAPSLTPTIAVVGRSTMRNEGST